MLAWGAGCSHQERTYPVDGTVVFSDGTPLANATVEFLITSAAGAKVNARGLTNESGEFTLHTFQPGDGALPGEQQAIVIAGAPLPMGNIAAAPRAPELAGRYRDYATSGLAYVVEPKANHFRIVVERGP